MKANELRIGNYVDLYGSIAILHPLDFENRCIDFEFKDFKPIKLTEKWLLGFGFKGIEGRHGKFFLHKEKELFRVWLSNADTLEWGVGRKDLDSINQKYNTHWVVLNLKYVHELQNLFFALTNEELKRVEGF